MQTWFCPPRFSTLWCLFTLSVEKHKVGIGGTECASNTAVRLITYIMQKRTVKKHAAPAGAPKSDSIVTEPAPPVESEASWASIDPRNGQVVGYEPATSRAIEAAFKAGKPTFDLQLGGNPFQILFGPMVQKNATGGSRKIIRRVPVDFTPPPPLTTAEVQAILTTVDVVDKAVDDLEKHEEDRARRLNLGSVNMAPILDAMNRIIQLFKSDKYRSKYGCDDEADACCLSLEFQQSVPSYFANVTDQSIFQRKMLSLCGLRNLIAFGPQIFEEMRAKLFSGCMEDYGPKEGPNKMRYFTGNVVDLDYVVLRCNDKAVLDAINKSQLKAGQPTFKDTNALAKSDVAKQIAIAQSQELISGFISRFKLTPAEVKQRRLEFDPTDLNIHVATGNSDRGMYALWHYSNVGQSSYHVNVPNMPDIYGALLRAPFHLAKAFALVFVRYPPGSSKFVEALDSFFDEAVADSCFNAKWKAIEEFVKSIDAKGTIPIVLSEIQAANQKIFTPEFFRDDPDQKKETEVMCSLSANTLARDPATGATRLITPADVAAWIQAQAI
jgi:hypothetical protein